MTPAQDSQPGRTGLIDLYHRALRGLVKALAGLSGAALMAMVLVTSVDVVLGKFMAMSLNAIYGLLAILPITGLPLLMGGVTGGEFWRMNLALLNALFPDVDMTK